MKTLKEQSSYWNKKLTPCVLQMPLEWLCLSNEGAPPARKRNPELFRPPSKATLAIQTVYGALALKPKESLTLDVLAQLTGLTKRKVTSACKALALRGLISRNDKIETIEKKIGKPTYKQVITVQYNEPWSKSTPKSW